MSLVSFSEQKFRIVTLTPIEVVPKNKKSGRFLSKTMQQIFANRFEIFTDDKLCL